MAKQRRGIPDMSLRKKLIASVRKRCSDSLSVKVERFLKTPVRDEQLPPFSVAILENGAVGIAYNLFHRDQKERQRYLAWDTGEAVAGRSADEAMAWLLSDDPLEKTVGMAVLNALSQDFLNKHPVAYRLDTQSDLFSLMQLDKTSRVGVVGFFRPMMQRLVDNAGEVVVIEQAPELLRESHPFTMTADPTALQACDKILITATTVLNDSLPVLMPHCANAAFVAMMGPTAGFLPDAVFELGVDAVGFTRVENLDLFMDRFASGGKWGQATRKVWAMPAG
jgi:uncharacterized protein (DUF4213/DUF364 family)